MENQLQNQEQVNLTPKKEWIVPMMEEMNINGGPAYLTSETASYMS